MQTRGSSNNALIIAIGSLLALGLLMFILSRMGNSPPATLLLHCAASNKPVVERVAKQFQEETGIEVQTQFGPSQTLLAGIEVTSTGDLYLPADNQYLKQAEEKQLTKEVYPLVTMHGVIVVPKGNPKRVDSLEALTKTGLRLSQANPEAAAIGKVSKDELMKLGQWDALEANTQSFKTTVNDVANDVKVGAADAGIVWDAVAVQYKDLELIEVPELKDVVGHVDIAVLTTSHEPEAANKFARYLSASDKGLKVYQELGFKTVEGKPWQP